MPVKKKQTRNKWPVTFRLSPEALGLLKEMAESQGISQTAILEVLIRREARRLERGK